MRDFGLPAGLVRRSRGAVARLVGCLTVFALVLVGAPARAASSSTPMITIGDVSVAEGNSGTTNATFTIQVSPRPKPCCSLQVDWATSPGNATAPADYSSASGTVSFSKNVGSRTVSVPIVGDTLDEPDETFAVTLSNLVGSPGTIGDPIALGTITDDDPLPGLTVNDVTVAEGNVGTTSVAFTVSLSPASGRSVTVNWATTVGTATAGTDYVSGSGSRTFAPGENAKTVSVTINGDVADEDDETFGIALSVPVNATITDGSGVATITDDDSAPTLTVNDVTVAEGDTGTTGAAFTISLSAASGRSVTVNWATTVGTATAGTDYVTASGSRTFAPGETSKPVNVTVNGDAFDEDDETFGIALSVPVNATIADGSGSGTITDDDPLPSVSIADASVTEGNAGTTTTSLTVTLTPASGRTVTVHWATSDDDAVSPADYVAAAGDLTFNPGQTSKSVDVTVKGDLVAELDEPFVVTLSDPVSTTIADGQAIGTIVDDEGLPVIDLDAPTVTEGNAGPTSLTFDVTLSNPSAAPITVDWTTAPGTASAGSDYVTTSGTVTFAPLDTAETVIVTVNGDTVYERDETVAVQLSNPTNAPIGHSQRLGIILNDDSPPVLSVGNATIAEGNAGTTQLTFVVTLAGASEVDTTVDYVTSDGTAAAGSDYVAATGTLTIPAGDSSGSVEVAVHGDLAHESDETFHVTLSNAVDATIAGATGTGTITNDDRTPTSITLKVMRKSRVVVGKGLLEPTTTGQRVTATLFRKQGTKYVKIVSKTVKIRFVKDRDGDGQKDGSYTASFGRPTTRGTYKIQVRFKGTPTLRPCQRSRTFVIPTIGPVPAP